MQTLGQIILKNKELTNMPYNNSLTAVQEREKNWLARWITHSDIERQFSPLKWGYTVANAERAYEADCPTLLTYDKLYGNGVASDWIHIQVLGLFGSSSCKDIGVVDGIELFAQSFSQEVKNFKLSELMLFFARYKAGRYDNSYSSFDAKRIGNAFFHEFVRERNIELDRINRKKEQEKIEKRRFTPPEGYTSLTWYRELQRRASEGDKDAIAILKGSY